MLMIPLVLLMAQGKPVTIKLLEFQWTFDRGEGVIRMARNQTLEFTSRTEIRRFEGTMTNRFGRSIKVPVAVRLVLLSNGEVQMQSYAVPDIAKSGSGVRDETVTLSHNNNTLTVKKGVRMKFKRGILIWDRPRSERLTKAEPFGVTLAKGDSVPAIVSPGIKLLSVESLLPVVKAAAKDHPLSGFVAKNPKWFTSRVPRRLENNSDLSLAAGDPQALDVLSDLRVRLILE